MPPGSASRHRKTARFLLGGLLFWGVCSVAMPTGASATDAPVPSTEADQDFARALAIWGDGKSQEAEALLNRALQGRQKQFGSNDPRVAEVIERLGALSYNREQYAEAEARFRNALDINVAASGERSLAAAYLMGDLGAALREEHRYGEAETIVEHSLALRRELLPPDDLAIAGSLNNLSHIYFGERRYADARQSLAEALRIYATSLPSDHPRLIEGRALLQRVDRAEAVARDLFDRMLMLAGAALISLVLLISCNLCLERRHSDDLSKRSRAVIVLATVSSLGFFISVGMLSSFAADWLVPVVLPSVGGDLNTLRNIGKIGFLSGVWMSAIALQILTNAGRRIVGLPVRPLVLFRRPAAWLRRRDSHMAPAEAPPFEGRPASAPWFAAMEYYALILNRTYKVFATGQMLCGAKVGGLRSTPSVVSSEMYNPVFWVQTPSAQRYDHLDLASEAFLRANSANFQFRWDQIAEIRYLVGKKWGMGNVPHSGRLVLQLRSGKRRELILLGDQNGTALKQQLDRYLATDAMPSSAKI